MMRSRVEPVRLDAVSPSPRLYHSIDRICRCSFRCSSIYRQCQPSVAGPSREDETSVHGIRREVAVEEPHSSEFFCADESHFCGPLIAIPQTSERRRTGKRTRIENPADSVEVNPMNSTVNVSKEATRLKVYPMEGAIARKNDLVSAVQTGSSGAFAQFHAIYSRRLYKRILAITRNPHDAEDALQETFLRAHSAIHAFEGRSNIYSWLTRIAINSALLILRRQRARAEILFDPQPNSGDVHCFEIRDSAPNPEQIYDLHQRRVKLLRAIKDLNAQLRTPLEMQIRNGSRIKEIGRALNISEAAVKTRLRRARRKVSLHIGRRNQGAWTQFHDYVATGKREGQMTQSHLSG